MLNICIAILLLTPEPSPLVPTQTYNGVQGGIQIVVDLPNGIDSGHVVLLDHDNKILAPASVVHEGSLNILAHIAHINNLQRAAWLQLLIDGQPMGSPIVIQPMLSRMVPLVERATRQGDDSKYTRIVGWRDEAEEDGITTPLVSGWRVYIDNNVIISTNEGEIHIALRPDAAPNTAWNFRELARGGFYNDTTFHRIVPMSRGFPFVIQGGDPTGSGSGGPGWWLPMEKSDLPHQSGVISMARADDPDSAGSQFFICLSREGTARLDGQYCAFGETVAGDDVIRALAETPLVDESLGKPKDPPVITTIQLVPSKPRYPSR